MDGGYADCAGIEKRKKEKDMQPTELAKYKKEQEHSAFFTMGVCAVAGVVLAFGLVKQEISRLDKQPLISANTQVQLNIAEIRSKASGQLGLTVNTPQR